MPQIIISRDAARGVRRCLRFLHERNAPAAMRAATTINRALRVLEIAPDIGRPCPTRPGARELLIPFGASGYVALYRHDAAADVVYILAFRHQKELGY